MWPYLGAEYGQNLEQSREQPGKVANPVLGHRNREHILFPFPVRTIEFGLARRVRPSCPASACSFLALILNLVLYSGSGFAFGDGVIYLYRQPPSGLSRVYKVTQMLSDSVHCRKAASQRRVVCLQSGSSHSCCLIRLTLGHFWCAFLSPHPFAAFASKLYVFIL